MCGEDLPCVIEETTKHYAKFHRFVHLVKISRQLSSFRRQQILELVAEHIFKFMKERQCLVYVSRIRLVFKTLFE